jgi:hypothetical protein
LVLFESYEEKKVLRIEPTRILLLKFIWKRTVKFKNWSDRGGAVDRAISYDPMFKGLNPFAETV